MRWKLLLFILLVSTTFSRGQVRVSEGVLEIPVYEEGLPDPNPSFDQFAGNRFSYPYTLRKEITDHRVEHQLRAIYLENEYLKCSVLPDIGGHVYTCIDKINGQPMFYANPSIKKARIGYRGAWAAFGIEFNFPVSHNWVSMSPVDFSYRNNPDGSASIIVGNIDRVYGMEWTVELSLRPGSTVLEQRVRLSNRSDVRHRFYWWSNAGVQIWDDSRIEYPMRFAAAHGFAEVQRWPVDPTGKDLSIIKNQTDGPVSLFVHGSRENFMGIWHPHTNTGTIHYADYGQLPAKKIWSWGVDADGLDWRKVLSDNDSAYAELQAGLFRNQETYAFLEPRQSIEFTEYWIPVRDIGGISRANRDAAVHLQRKNEILEISLNVNRKLTGANIQVLDTKVALMQEKVDLIPEKVWKKEVQIPDPSRKYTIVLVSSDGTTLLSQTEDAYDWLPESEVSVGPQKNYAVPEESRRTEDDWLQAGKAEELNGALLAAVQTYQKALKRFPTSFELAKAAGRLAAGLSRFDRAIPNLVAAHERDTADGEVSYYLGIAYDGLERQTEAVAAYEAAMRLPAQRGAAALRLAELKARGGNLPEARDLIAESLRSVPNDFRASEELVALLRAAGDAQAAGKLAKDLLVRNPLSDLLHAEAGNLDIAHLAADPYRVLNLATEYARLGLFRNAVQILSRDYPRVKADESEPGTELPQNNPLVPYFSGYCREKLGESGAADYAQASRLSTLYVFPSTIENKRSLQSALQSNPNDATAHYLLGTWHFARAETPEALREWQIARELNPKIPTLEASIGLALLYVQRDFTGALRAFDEGIKTDPTNIVNYSGSVAALTLLGKSAAERVKALEHYPDKKMMPTPLVYELALNRAEAGNFEAAIDLFKDRFFGREEGGTNVRQVWLEVKLEQTAALAKSGHCHEALSAAKGLASPVPGVPFTQDGLGPMVSSARTNYMLGEVYSACGDKEQALKKFEVVSQAVAVGDLLWAWAAAKKQTGFNAEQWKSRLLSAASQAEATAKRSALQGWWLYTAGALRLAAGQEEQGVWSFRETLLLPENLMSHHFSRLALAGAIPR
jgi:tetratricopeptide (TPR) repeat protein